MYAQPKNERGTALDIGMVVWLSITGALEPLVLEVSKRFYMKFYCPKRHPCTCKQRCGPCKKFRDCQMYNQYITYISV